MPYLASIQQSGLSSPQMAPFLLPEEAKWYQNGEIAHSLAALQEPLEAIIPWRQVDASTVRVPTFQVEWLERRYIFRKPKEVSWFLELHRFLVPLLFEAYGQMENYFGPHPQVFLEVVRDPEVQGLVEMFGYIVSKLTSEEAGRQLQRFDREWFLLQIPRTKGLLNFDVEFL